MRVPVHGGIAPVWEARVGRLVGALARAVALAAGMVLAGLALMTVASIIGRMLVFAGLGPIPGDFELVEIGCAVAVFGFLPWCQYRGGHVTVDVLVNQFPARARAALALLGNVALSVAAVLILWRLVLGTVDKFAYGETTMILGAPLGWGYGASVVGAALFVVVCLFTVWRSLNDTLRGGERVRAREPALAGPES